MQLRYLLLRLPLLSALGLSCVSPSFAQEPGTNRQSPDVVRVNTSLVQTDVMVFDRQGGFVDGLTRDQFSLKVDGKPRDISFFEHVVAGSRNEEAQLAAARGNSGRSNAGAVPLDRGRTVFFFIDDMHLSAASTKQTRMLLERFIDREMGQNDEAAIASSSGQIGFLQQLTDDKRVLHAAADRLMTRSYTARDSERPPMSEYQAQLIEAGNDDVLDFFVDELMRINFQLPRNLAADEVRGRASQISHQTASLTERTLDSLQALVKNSARLPGRKVIFLISDGFLLDSKNGDSYYRMGQITAAAATSGVIIYSIDARGLTSSAQDVSTEVPFDPAGRLSRSAGGELGATQNGLSALASDTGGRAFFNSNALSPAVNAALKETSVYYLLAWRPDDEDRKNQKPRNLEVSIKGRTDLVIRFRRSFGDSSAAQSASRTTKDPTATPKLPTEIMAQALRAPYPKADLPVAVSLNFLDLVQVGGTLTTSIMISTDSLVLETQAGSSIAGVDVAGGVFDDQGKPVSSFSKHLTIKAKSGDQKVRPPDHIFYNYFCVIKPGLYQVRVAAVDPKQGRAGSAVRWISIPDLGSKALTLSSLIVGERKATPEQPDTLDETDPAKAASAIRQVSLNVDHRFASSSHLRFLTFVYNAAGNSGGVASTLAPVGRGTAEPNASVLATSNAGPGTSIDLAVQVQLFRDNEPVLTTPLHKIQIDGTSDVRRLPYAAEVPLDGLQPGRYVLLVTVIDRVAKASASQRFGFQVD